MQGSSVDLRVNDVPPELLWKVKEMAAVRRITLRQLVIELLQETVAKGEKHKKV
jgi:hypothetical protein